MTTEAEIRERAHIFIDSLEVAMNDKGLSGHWRKTREHLTTNLISLIRDIAASLDERNPLFVQHRAHIKAWLDARNPIPPETETVEADLREAREIAATVLEKDGVAPSFVRLIRKGLEDDHASVLCTLAALRSRPKAEAGKAKFPSNPSPGVRCQVSGKTYVWCSDAWYETDPAPPQPKQDEDETMQSSLASGGITVATPKIEAIHFGGIALSLEEGTPYNDEMKRFAIAYEAAKRMAKGEAAK